MFVPRFKWRLYHARRLCTGINECKKVQNKLAYYAFPRKVSILNAHFFPVYIDQETVFSPLGCQLFCISILKNILSRGI